MLTIDTRGSRIYPFMILASFLLGLGVQFLLNRSRGIRRDIAALTILSAFLCSVGGGLLLTIATTRGTNVGFSSIGGLAGMYAGGLLVALVSRRPYYPTIIAQTCTLVLPLMYSVSKLGCLFAGCCRGITWHGAGGLTYLTDDGTLRVLPIQLIESVCFLLLFVGGIILFRRRQRAAVHLVFQAAAWTKLLLDFLRESHTGQVLYLTQILCLVLLAADGVILLLGKRRAQTTHSFRENSGEC